MPLPALLAGAVTALAAAIVIDDILTGGRISDAIGKKAAQLVLDARGIPLDLDGEINHFTITAAINAAVMPDGVAFENVFDKDAIKRDVKRIALGQAAQAFGFEGGTDIDVLKEQIISRVMAEVRDDIAAGGGDYMDATKGLAAVQRLINRPEPKDWQVPRVFTAKAEKNRERQATYRASHKRKWITQ